MPATDDIFELLALTRAAASPDAQKADLVKADAKLNEMIRELTALRAVAEAARSLPTVEHDSLTGAEIDTFVQPELLRRVTDALAALDRVREGGGG